VKDVSPHYIFGCTTVAREVIILVSIFILIDRRGEKSSSY